MILLFLVDTGVKEDEEDEEDEGGEGRWRSSMDFNLQRDKGQKKNL